MFKSVTLEVSLKPFKKTDDQYIKNVCEGIFKQWYALVKNCDTVSILLWTSDGSEILDYTGDMDKAFEWCYFMGTASLEENEITDYTINPHLQKYKYIENPPTMTYGILKKIINTFKSEGQKILPNAKIRVGETFDIGPEFAISDFKYKRHTEICEGSEKLGDLGFVDCTATLHADNYPYAAYKNGILEGTPIGEFLGKQANIFLKDLGFDYLWLSNGFGFSADPWSLKGKVYDGENFDLTKLELTRKKVFEFWKHFRAACPDFPIEVRGTNNSVGIDYATDAVPIFEIYNGGFNITPPPNSPWAAINDDFGLEIMGHMTRVCELPCNDFMFRFYIHDPWWINSPWYDRYDGCAADIYLPLAVTRIDENGKTQSAEMFNILTIDNSYGNMPDSCVNEPLPHILKAKKDAGDAPAPFVWVYPMREYSTALTKETIADMYHGDNYIRAAINNGLPLNCVVSSDIYLNHNTDIYKGSIMISPMQVNSAVNEKLVNYAKSGGKVIFYGNNDALNLIENHQNIVKVDMLSSPENIRQALENFGYKIKFNMLKSCKPPTLTVARSNNGFFFSVYNTNTTTKTSLLFPLGAPILLGGETELVDGYSTYQFGRCEHRECRIFIKQKSGVISAREMPPINAHFRRRFLISGLNDADVYYFPETYCAKCAAVGPTEFNNEQPKTVLDDRFKPEYSEEYGNYYHAEHITGDFDFYMPNKQFVK